MSKISGTGKVPALADGSVQVWESLAILEYLAEKFPAAGLWPADPAARALARALAAEMHAGFVPLRRHLPMNMWRPVDAAGADPRGTGERPAHRRHLDRLPHALRQRRRLPVRRLRRADAMYAPVVSRFHTYAVEVGAVARAYMEAVMALPAWREWRTARIGGALGAAGGRGGLADRYARMTEIVTAAALAPAASKTKKCRGCVLIPARERKKYTPIL